MAETSVGKEIHWSESLAQTSDLWAMRVLKCWFTADVWWDGSVSLGVITGDTHTHTRFGLFCTSCSSLASRLISSHAEVFPNLTPPTPSSSLLFIKSGLMKRNLWVLLQHAAYTISPYVQIRRQTDSGDKVCCFKSDTYDKRLVIQHAETSHFDSFCWCI